MNRIARTRISRQLIAWTASESSGSPTAWLDLLRRSAIGVLEHTQRGSRGVGVDGIAVTEVRPENLQGLRDQLFASATRRAGL